MYRKFAIHALTGFRTCSPNHAPAGFRATSALEQALKISPARGIYFMKLQFGHTHMIQQHFLHSMSPPGSPHAAKVNGACVCYGGPPQDDGVESSNCVANCYSMTSLASFRMLSGTVMPSACAVLRLITRSNLVAICTGSSAGRAPLRMRAV